MTAARPALVAPERLAPHNSPMGPVERSLLAVARYKTGAPLSYDERGLMLEQLCHELRTSMRRGWWEWDVPPPTTEEVLAQMLARGWRQPELTAAVAFLRACGVVL